MSKKDNNRKEKTLDIEKLENQLKRAVADYQNLEKRMDSEKREWIRSGNKGLILKFLPVLDILFLAQGHIKDEGLSLSIEKFLEILKEEGVEKIETEGQDFDPNKMECVSVQEGAENKVLSELRPGFVLSGQTLRPSQVIVGLGSSHKDTNPITNEPGSKEVFNQDDPNNKWEDMLKEDNDSQN